MLSQLPSLVVLFLLLALAACAGSVESPSDEEQQTVSPATEEAPAATETSAPTPTPEATPTATQPPATPTPEAEPTTTPTPSATPDPSQLFHFSGTGESSAVVRRATSGGWDATYVNPGAMVIHGGQFHMFRNAFKTWPGEINIGYMTSEDGRNWQSVSDDPLFTSDDIPYVEDGAAVSSVVVGDDGTWMLYFHTLDRPGVIGRLTAPAPEGPWTPDPQPVLTPGGDEAWDGTRVGWQSVVKTEEGYVMYYAGNKAFTTQIGRATSPDGATWTKYDDPDTTEPLYAQSDPVLLPEQEWQRGDVGRPEARLTPEGWVMLYVGNDLNTRGLAFSEDGIHWTHHEENPIINDSHFPISGSTWDTALLHRDDTYLYYMEIGNLSGTDIYLATHEGELFP